MNQDNIFPLTEQEILEQFPQVFNNPFQTRTIVGRVFNIHTDHISHSWFSESHTKGYSTSAILINKDNEKDYVEFWKYYKNSKIQYGYSFKRRELFPTILN